MKLKIEYETLSYNLNLMITLMVNGLQFVGIFIFVKIPNCNPLKIKHEILFFFLMRELL